MPEVEATLNTVFFTEKDQNITGTSQRDPLGFQPIWSFYARQAINHLTTISTTIHGFREVLLCLSICRDVFAKDKSNDFFNLILLFEQLFIYTAISKNRVEGILGADNGSAKFHAHNENPEISSNPKKTILVREISLGYFGRYKTPLTTMNIINSKGELQVDLNDIKSLYGKDRYQEIFEAFTKFLKAKKRLNDFDAKNELFKAVFGKFRTGERDFWIKRLYENNGKQKELMKLCYEKTDEDVTTRDLFLSLSQWNEVTDILKLEPYLLCLEQIFYKAMTSKEISNIQISNKDKKEHIRRFNDFCNISNFNETSLFSKRMKFLKEKCSPDSDTYIENVLKYHKLVCEQKKSSVWVDMQNDGKLQAFVHAENGDIDIDNWNRDYYILSLKSIKKEDMEFSK